MTKYLKGKGKRKMKDLSKRLGKNRTCKRQDYDYNKGLGKSSFR